MKEKRVITHSELSTYQDCPTKWWFKYHERLSSSKEQSRLSFGRAIHEALAEYYLADAGASISKFNILVDYMVNEAKSEEELIELADMRELGLSMLNMYMDFAMVHDDFQVVHIEKSFDIPVMIGKRKSRNFRYAFTPDGVVRKGGKLWVMEHKTAKSIDNGYIENLALDEQMSRYCSAVEYALGEEVMGVVYNIIRKSKPRVPTLLKSGELSKDKSIDTTYDAYKNEVLSRGLQLEDYSDILDILRAKGNTFVRREVVLRNSKEKKQAMERLYTLAKIVASKTPIYKCPSRDCSWKCNYRPLCIEDSYTVRELSYRIRESYHPELEEKLEEKGEVE